MGEEVHGTLCVRIARSGPKVHCRFEIVRKGSRKGYEQPVPDMELHPDLRAPDRHKLEGVEVVFDWRDGQVRNVRPAGAARVASAPNGGTKTTTSSDPARSGDGSGHDAEPAVEPRPPWVPAPAPPGDFHNPYGFVPAPPRRTSGPLGDSAPAGHDAFADGLWSGRIRVGMSTETPLLMVDAATAEGPTDGHRTFDVRTDPAGKPYVPPTSVKGMLRAAYEAVTNSRMGIFFGYEDRLARRMAAGEGLSLVPARVAGNQLELLMGTTAGLPTMSRNGRWNVPGPMYAAWLPRWDGGTGAEASSAVRYAGGGLPQHREKVDAWLELVERRPFEYWRVRKVVRAGTPLGPAPSQGPVRGAHRPTGTMRQVSGWVCVSGWNIRRKHDERLFFTAAPRPPTVPIDDTHRKAWRELVKNYQDAHYEEILKGQEGPPALDPCKWSRHVTGGDAERDLSDGTLCYARVEEVGCSYQVHGLYPVTIARKLFAVSPASLLPASVQPATSPDALSPADRVFGWVCQDGAGAHRGQLRVGPVSTEREDAIERHAAEGVPLAILGQPKPQQARFYVAASTEGDAQASGLEPQRVEYSELKGLRGRKVYPHHAGLPKGYWDEPSQQRVIGGRHQEFRRPDGQDQRDKQNRSIRSWVRPGVDFAFDVDVLNLTDVELGALLWLLELPEGCFHRLGGAKPLGFGSVRLHVVTHELRRGEEWRSYYGALCPQVEATDPAPARSAFRAASRGAFGAELERIPFIAAFLRAARGFADGLPVHYPRVRGTHGSGPDPDGENFRWFSENESPSGNKRTLPDLVVDRGLPYYGPGAPRG